MELYDSLVTEHLESLEPKRKQKKPKKEPSNPPKKETIITDDLLITPEKYPEIKFNTIEELLTDPFSCDIKTANKHISTENSDNIPNFEDIPISTKTVIAVTNMQFDLPLIFEYLQALYINIPEKKRGRRKADDDSHIYIPTIEDITKKLTKGTILSMKRKNETKGTALKPDKSKKKDKESKSAPLSSSQKAPKKEDDPYFLNSITINIVVEPGKIVNTKITRNGKFQMTGCRENTHDFACVLYIMKHIITVERLTGERLHIIRGKENPVIIFNIVMKNIDFKIDFLIQRDKLDTFFNDNTEFISLFEASVNAGVNIKLDSTSPFDPFMFQLEIFPNGTVTRSVVPFEKYCSYLLPKDLKKKLSKAKHHTFMTFHTGSCIQSGSGPEMGKVFKKFLKILIENKKYYEEKLLLGPIDLEGLDAINEIKQKRTTKN